MDILFTTQLQSEGQRLFDTCITTPDKYSEIDTCISKMVQARQRYESVHAGTNVPWHVIAVVHYMQGSLSLMCICKTATREYSKLSDN